MNITPMNDQASETVSCVLSIDPVKEKITAVLPAGATIEGALRLKEGGRIGGVVKGNVISESGTLLIDSSAIVEGDIVAKGRCIVLGQVGTSSHRSTIRCEKIDGLTISHAAQIHANIEHNGISATNVSGMENKYRERIVLPLNSKNQRCATLALDFRRVSEGATFASWANHCDCSLVALEANSALSVADTHSSTIHKTTGF